MQARLADRGFEFVRQYKVDRWHLDLARPPLALELERRRARMHDGSDPVKYERLLGLLDQGWYVLAMYPPFIDGWDEAVDHVVRHLADVEAGVAPRYLWLEQYKGHEHWQRFEGSYASGRLTVVDKSPELVCTQPGCQRRSKHLGEPCPEHGGERFWQPGDRPCRVRSCGDFSLPGSPHCSYHAPIFERRERERVESRRVEELAREERRLQRETRRHERQRQEQERAERRREREARKEADSPGSSISP